MNRIKIFCEGITDQVFIADCLSVFYNIQIEKSNHKDKHKWDISFSNNCQIIEIGGCCKLSDKFYLDILKDNFEEGGKNIVVFDADFGPDSDNDKKGTGNNGFENATKKLEALKKNELFEFYLWPNNDADGEIENLLRQLIPKEKELVIKCIENHQECLKSSKIKDLNIADLKAQVGYYLHTVSKNSLARNRDYKDSNFWNLGGVECENLLKFKLFLDNFFIKNNDQTTNIVTGK